MTTEDLNAYSLFNAHVNPDTHNGLCVSFLMLECPSYGGIHKLAFTFVNIGAK